jgi:NAD(P)-dependent dehydrogenase (short-subunit alcohol dehydrogenase family)
MQGQRVLVVGASEGIGLAVAQAAAQAGASVTIAGRHQDKLDAAAAGSGLATLRLDAGDEAEVAAYFAACEPWDHLVTLTAGRRGPMAVAQTPVEAAQTAFAEKFWTQYRVVKHGAGKVKPGGSIILTSGQLSRRYSPGLAWLSAINAGLEALARGLALELATARVRVNVICPGTVDTAILDRMAPDAKQAFLAGVAGRLPVGYVAKPADLAAAYLYLMTSPYSNASVVDVDGGGAR